MSAYLLNTVTELLDMLDGKTALDQHRVNEIRADLSTAAERSVDHERINAEIERRRVINEEWDAHYEYVRSLPPCDDDHGWQIGVDRDGQVDLMRRGECETCAHRGWYPEEVGMDPIPVRLVPGEPPEWVDADLYSDDDPYWWRIEPEPPTDNAALDAMIAALIDLEESIRMGDFDRLHKVAFVWAQRHEYLLAGTETWADQKIGPVRLGGADPESNE